MRTKYDTPAIVLARSPFGEVSAHVTLLTPELGLVRALAQSVRQEGAKLAPALTTFSESDVHLVRGKSGWQVTGAVLIERWIMRLEATPARVAAARISGLVTRLAGDDVHDPELFAVVRAFFEALARVNESDYESCELLAALRVLAVLGFDAGQILGGLHEYSPEVVARVPLERSEIIARINRGITASGL